MKNSPLTIPNCLTISRIILIPIILIGILEQTVSSVILAVLLYIVTCLTDYFDGYLARRYQQSSNLGRILDPIADKLLVSSILLTLAYNQSLTHYTLIAALIILSREFIVAGLRDFLSTQQVVLPSSRLAKWKTFLQMLALGFLIFGDPFLYGRSDLFFLAHQVGTLLLWMATLATIFTGYSYIQETFRKLAG